MGKRFSLELIEEKYRSLTGYSFESAVDQLFVFNKQACDNQFTIFSFLKDLYQKKTNNIENYFQAEREDQKSLSIDFFKITFSFLRKNLSTAQDIQLLIENNRWESAQSLVRVLVENFINYVCFIKLFNKEPKLTCGKYYAFNGLTACKEWRLSSSKEFLKMLKNPSLNWNRVALAGEYLKNLSEIIEANLSETEFDRLKKYGFTGKPLEQNAKFSGYVYLYDIYRSFSKKIHSSDFFDHMMELSNDINILYFSHRKLMISVVLNDCVLTFSENINEHFNLDYFKIISDIRQKSEVFVYDESLL